MKRLVLCAVLAACGGGGDDDGGGGGDAGGGGDIDSGAGMVTGSASVLHGPSAMGPAVARSVGGPAQAADGRWAVSPDSGQATLTSIALTGAEPGVVAFAELTDCTFTYDRDDEALDEMLSCPFEVPPGTYINVGVSMSTTFQVLIDDATNGIFTDPASETLLSGTEPDGGAALVPFTVPGPGGVGDELNSSTFLAEPLVLEEGDSLTIRVVTDMTQTVEVDVSGADIEFRQDFKPVPVFMFATSNDVARTAYYTSAGTAESVLEGDFPPNTMRFFYESEDTPSFVWAGAATAGCQMGDTPSNAWAVSHEEAPADDDGNRAGGYLGLDGGGDLCWVLPHDGTWEAGEVVFRMPEVTTLGETSAMVCERTTDIPAPAEGDTYASGCPDVGETGSATLTLVAQ
ncbi:MAG TPA: hypothetical protein VMZ28_20880 [Kofleriaceae bacterium]|nr:hypothetical protein [Kofleriaceae bacterium]